MDTLKWAILQDMLLISQFSTLSFASNADVPPIRFSKRIQWLIVVMLTIGSVGGRHVEHEKM
jgi:hypothetical protein